LSIWETIQLYKKDVIESNKDVMLPTQVLIS